MKYNFDPKQETHEEYLRRIHAKDKLTMEWNKNDQKENEFVMADNVIINSSWVRELMDYIDKNSNLSVQWIDREHFVEPSMMGFRLVKKTKIEKKQN